MLEASACKTSWCGIHDQSASQLCQSTAGQVPLSLGDPGTVSQHGTRDKNSYTHLGGWLRLEARWLRLTFNAQARWRIAGSGSRFRLKVQAQGSQAQAHLAQAKAGCSR